MFYLLALLAGLSRLLVSGLDSQQSFVDITVPRKIISNITNPDLNNEMISYIISVEGRVYTMHTRRRLFLPDDFIVYMYNREGSLTSSTKSSVKFCNYQGYVDGSPHSVVTLHTCSGLRGLMQFENVTYGIEPLESAGGFQHLVYRLQSENLDPAILTDNKMLMKSEDLEYKVDSGGELRSLVSKLPLQYVELYIVLDKGLYDHMGSDVDTVTNKVVQILGLINAMFSQFRMTVVLSSLEFWTNKNKISTTGEPEEILQRFLEWKNSYLVLRPHDIAYLFVYREHPTSLVATFPGKMCMFHYGAGVALYPKGITIEAFSVVVAQMLGFSLGMKYDNNRCYCLQSTCIMNPKAVLTSGTKVFSSCSISDVHNFISKTGAKCLRNQPTLKYYGDPPTCGNYVVEGEEDCDCGSADQCQMANCCNPETCRKQDEANCIPGICCTRNCEFIDKIVCRPAYDPYCDFPENCNGTYGKCPLDLRAKDGSMCANRKGVCFRGRCQDPDKHCQDIYGKASRNAPFACYEEINSQQDRFGHCGQLSEIKFKFCAWKNIRCGKLICTYPYRKPFIKTDTSVIYTFILNHVCISSEHKLTKKSGPDPLMIPDGSPCDIRKFCFNNECIYLNSILNEARQCAKQRCHNHGACTDDDDLCLCELNYKPPDCFMRKSRSVSEFLPWKSDHQTGKAAGGPRKNWLLISFYIFLPILLITGILAIKRKTLKGCLNLEESSITESGSEFSTYSYTSSSEHSTT